MLHSPRCPPDIGCQWSRMIWLAGCCISEEPLLIRYNEYHFPDMGISSTPALPHILTTNLGDIVHWMEDVRIAMSPSQKPSRSMPSTCAVGCIGHNLDPAFVKVAPLAGIHVPVHILTPDDVVKGGG